MKSALLFWLWLSFSISTCRWNGGCRSVSASPFQHDVVLLGVAPQDEEYYRGWSSAGTLKCKDGSKHFSKSQLNDDFCDCPDGSDEPGTSACPIGKFYCNNAGHVPLSIYSSRVSDGICDCCDGSDEYDGKIKCPNTCWEAGKVARDKLKKKIATYLEGVTIRKQEVEQAKEAIAKEEAELLKLKDEEKILKGLVEQLKEQKEEIERQEEKERLQKEKEEAAKKVAEEAKLKENKTTDAAKVPEGETTKVDIHNKIEPQESSSAQDDKDVHDIPVVDAEHTDKTTNEGPLRDEAEQGKGKDRAEHVKDDSHHDVAKEDEAATEEHEADVNAGNEGKDVTEETESLSREELGRRVASRWTGEKIDEEAKEVDSTPSTDDESHDSWSEDHDEEYTYDSENEEDKYDVDDDDDANVEEHKEDFSGEDHVDSSSYKYESDDESDFSDTSRSSNPSWLEKIQETVRRILQTVNLFRKPVDRSEAARIRKEYDELSSKLSKMQSRISRLTKKLKQDLGPEKEFYSFYGQCFESKQNKYVYKICPYKQATQSESYSTTRLGDWDKFEDSYRTMQFSRGDKCWNGPDRSLKVKLRCGLKNEVSDVDEPSRCEYLAFLSTPALCQEEKLKELQEKLDTMMKELPAAHDEL